MKRLEIKRAIELLKSVRHAAMATVNKDGSPHNTPYKFMISPDLKYLYWGSHAKSLHSKNIIRTGQLYVALYDAKEKGGLYIKADEGHITEGKELKEALKIHNQIRIKEQKTEISLDYYTSPNPQRMWKANVTNFWVNSVVVSIKGLLIRDIRIEIKPNELLKYFIDF